MQTLALATSPDWVGAALAFSALIVSILAYLHVKSDGRKVTFLRLHEQMLAEDQSRGRRLLYAGFPSVTRLERLEIKRPDTFYLADGAALMLDVFAMYVNHKYVDRQVALTQWEGTLRRAKPAIDQLTALRVKQRPGMSPFPNYYTLMRELDGG